MLLCLATHAAGPLAFCVEQKKHAAVAVDDDDEDAPKLLTTRIEKMMM